MSALGGGGNPCTKCNETVFAGETIMFEKKPYHVNCFSCSVCLKKQNPGGMTQFVEDDVITLYCTHCFQKEGLAQKQRNVKWVKKETKANPLASKFGGGGTKCFVCDKTVYPAEQVSLSKKPFHAGCIRCQHVKDPATGATCDKKFTPSGGYLYEDKLVCSQCFKDGNYAQQQRNVKWTKKEGTSSGSSKFGGGGDKCEICEKTVYSAEALSFEKKKYHAACFTCSACSKKMTPAVAAQFQEEGEEKAQLFCTKCFKEGGYTQKQAKQSKAGGGGTSNALASKFGGGGEKCKRCDKTVYPAETVAWEKQKFHQQCFKCDDCGKKLTTSSAEYTSALPDAIHCKQCFVQKGLNRA
jgi:cysteine/glycine-rich protein